MEKSQRCATSPKLGSAQERQESKSCWSRHQTLAQLIALCLVFSAVNTVLIKANLGAASQPEPRAFTLTIRKETRQRWTLPSVLFHEKSAANSTYWNPSIPINHSRIHELYKGIFAQQRSNQSATVPVCVVASNPRQRSLFSSGIYTLALGEMAEFSYHVHEPSYCLHRGSCSSLSRAQHPDCHVLQPTVVLNDHTRCCHKARFVAIQRMISNNYFDLAIVTGDEYCDVRKQPKARRPPHHYRQYHFAKQTSGYIPLGPRSEFRRVDASEEIVPAWRKKYLFNFVGSLNTNRMRGTMLAHIQAWLTTSDVGQMLDENPSRSYFIHVAKQWTGAISQSTGHIEPDEYRKILLDSAFTLCPAGHNPESYRIYEAIEAGSIPILALDRAYEVFDCTEAFAPFVQSEAPFPMLKSWKQVGQTLERAVHDPAWVVELQINCTVWLRRFLKVHAREFQDRLRTRWSSRLMESNLHYDAKVVTDWLRVSTNRRTYFGKTATSFNYGGTPQANGELFAALRDMAQNYSFWGNKRSSPSPDQRLNFSAQTSTPVCVVSFMSKGAGLFFQDYIARYSSGKYSYNAVSYARHQRDCSSDSPTIFISNYADLKRGAFKRAEQSFDVTILTSDDRCKTHNNLHPHFRQFYSESRINPVDGGTEQSSTANLLPLYIPLGPRPEFIAAMHADAEFMPTSQRRLLFSFAGSATSAARKSLRKLNFSDFEQRFIVHFTDSFANEPRREQGYLDPNHYSKLLRSSKFALVPGKL